MSSEYVQSEPKSPTADSSGKLVDVVERDMEQSDSPTRVVDDVITPTSIKRMEQDAETLERDNADVERKLRQ